MAKFSAKDTLELETNVDLFMRSIALEKNSKYRHILKNKIIKKIQEFIIYPETPLEEINSKKRSQ